VITQGEIQGIYKKWFESPIPPDQVNLRMPMSYMLRDSFKVPTDWLPN
jgi:glutamate/aspartate transport system substrate-binding protein